MDVENRSKRRKSESRAHIKFILAVVNAVSFIPKMISTICFHLDAAVTILSHESSCDRLFTLKTFELQSVVGFLATMTDNTFE